MPAPSANAGPAVIVAGLAAAVAGTFAMPVLGEQPGDVVRLRAVAAGAGGFAAAWWRVGVLAGFGVLVAVAAILLAGASRRPTGFAIAVVAAAVAVAQEVAVHRSPAIAGYTALQARDRPAATIAATGSWVALVGLVVVALGGLLVTRSQPDSARPGGVVALLGLATFAAGAFALPQTASRSRSGDIGFVSLRAGAGHDTFGTVAARWWHYGAFTAGAAVTLLLAAAAVAAMVRLLGAALAGLAAATAVLHAVAVHQTPDYVMSQFRTDPTSATLYRDAGAGIWVALAGAVLTAAGGAIMVRRNG